MFSFRWLRPVLLALPLPLLAGAGNFVITRAKASTSRPAVEHAPALPGARVRRSGAGQMPVGLPHVARRLAQPSPLRIIAFGSSSTQGIGASSAAASYPSRLQHELSNVLPHHAVEVINRGVGGEDAEDFARRLPSILNEHADLIIFQTGTNDPLRGVSVERFTTLTRDAIERMQANGVDVMLMEPQLCHVTQTMPNAIFYRDAVRRLAVELAVPVVRRWELMETWVAKDMVTPAKMLAPDGLHMADAGYALLAKEVAREILLDAGATPMDAQVMAPIIQKAVARTTP